MTPQRSLSRFSRYLWLTLGMFVVFASTFVLYVWPERQVDRANEVQAKSDLLADVLRQSGPRAGRRQETSFGAAVPLLELMRRSGFTDQEFAKLAAAQR